MFKYLALKTLKSRGLGLYPFSGRGRLFSAANRQRRLPQERGRLAPSRVTSYSNYAFPYKDYRPVEDRRTWHPSGTLRPVRTARGTGAMVKARSRVGQSPFAAPAALSFVDPSNVLVCVRRQRRKQVLHALGIAGGTGFKAPRFNRNSLVSCEG